MKIRPGQGVEKQRYPGARELKTHGRPLQAVNPQGLARLGVQLQAHLTLPSGRGGQKNVQTHHLCKSILSAWLGREERTGVNGSKYFVSVKFAR